MWAYEVNVWKLWGQYSSLFYFFIRGPRLSKNPVPLYQKNAFKEITSQYNLANDKVWTLAEQPKFS